MGVDAGTIDLSALEQVGAGYEAEVFAYSDDKVIRLFRPDRERAPAPDRLATAAALGGGLVTPNIYEDITLEGRPGFWMDRVYGQAQFDYVASHPWMFAKEVVITSRIQARMHNIVAPPELPPVHEEIRILLYTVPLPDDLLQLAERVLNDLEPGDRLLHGDYHPGNLIIEPSGRHVVIDWRWASIGPPEADLSCTLAIYALAQPLDMHPAILYLQRNFVPFGNWLYKKMYSRIRDYDLDLLRKWGIVNAVRLLGMARTYALFESGSHVVDPLPQVEKYVNNLREQTGY